MNKLFFISVSLILLGAGCAGGGAAPTVRKETPPRAAEKAPVAGGERQKSDDEKRLAAPSCPITPDIVRARCGIPAEIKLTDYSIGFFDICGVAVDTSSGKSTKEDQLNYWQQTANATYPFLTVTPTSGYTLYLDYKAPTSEKVKEAAALEAAGEFYSSLSKIKPEAVADLGAYAFYARKLWSKEDSDNGRKDAGFAISFSDGKLAATLDSGGADLNVGEIVPSQDSNIKFKQLGAGCDRAEVEGIARDIILPHLTAIEAKHERK